MAINNEDSLWLGMTKSGNGIRIFVPQGNGEKDKLYVASIESLRKLLDGEIKGFPMARVVPD